MKACRECKKPVDRQGARGLCHRCYENFRYQRNPAQIQAVNKKSHLRHREKRLAGQRAWRAKNIEKVRAEGKMYRQRHKERLKIYYDEWKKLNRDTMRNSHLKRNFGITLAEYDALLKAQDGVCAICRKPQGARNKKNLCVDHDHKTGAIRGLLCSRCNNAIGLIDDDPECAKRMTRYLKGGTDVQAE